MKHCIIVKYKPEVDDACKARLASEIRGLFEAALKIEGIHRIEVRKNVVRMPNRYDLLIEMDMDETALPKFDGSILHRQWKEQYGSILQNKTIIDLE